MADQTRINLAKKYLRNAILFFLKGHFDSAWRLAAAADEILRKWLSERVENSFQWEYKPSIITEAEDLAQWMIVRACRNYHLLGLPRTAKMREFDKWFDEHVIGWESEAAFYKSETAFYRDVVGLELP